MSLKQWNKEYKQTEQWKTKQSTSQAAEFKAKQEGLLSFTNLVQITGQYIG